jgi:putative transposase
VLAEQHDEWSEQRRYMGLEILAKTDAVGILSETNDEEVMLPATVVA